MNPDPVFDLIAAHNDLPAGWGFPALHPAPTPEGRKALALRKALFPFHGEEGVAQLVRWYYGIVRSYPAIAMGIGAGDETYDPGLAWKPSLSIDSEEVHLTVDPGRGAMDMRWVPGAGVTRLDGAVAVSGSDLTLELGGSTYDLPYDTTEEGVLALVWPPFLRTRAGLTGLPTRGFAVAFRPMRFDAGALASSASTVVSPADVAGVGAAGLWYGADPEQKLAICWAVMKNLRHVT